MKNVIKIATHMLISGSSVLLFVRLFHSSWELAGYCLMTMLLAVLLCTLRSKVESFWVFVGSHFVLLFGGSFLISIVGFYKWYIAIWCFWILYSVILRLAPVAEGLEEPTLSYVLILGLEYFCACVFIKSNMAQSLYLIATAIVFLLYLLYRNLESVDEFIMVGGFSNKEDEQGIRSLNHRLSTLYIGIMGVLLAIFSLFRVDGVWRTIKSWIYTLLRYLARLIPITEQMRPKEEAEKKEETVQFLQEMTETQEIPIWAKVLSDIIRDVVVILMVAVVIYAIVRGVIFVYRHFYNKRQYEDGDKVIESLSVGHEVAKKKKPVFFEGHEKSAVRRIRKIYKKCLKRTGAKRIPKFQYMTPDEQVELLRNQGMPEETIEEIKYLYEKARYSENLVTEKDVEQMRKNV